MTVPPCKYPSTDQSKPYRPSHACSNVRYRRTCPACILRLIDKREQEENMDTPTPHAEQPQVRVAWEQIPTGPEWIRSWLPMSVPLGVALDGESRGVCYRF